jgi:hypothetical protein
MPATPTPKPVKVGQWIEGHYWSIRVDATQVETDLDGETPSEDVFVIVDVDWRGDDLDIKHIMSGADYELVDDMGDRYPIVGMIFEEETYDSFGDDAKFHRKKWIWTRASGDADKTYRLVFDVPDTANGLKLWFRNFAPIELGVDLGES